MYQQVDKYRLTQLLHIQILMEQDLLEAQHYSPLEVKQMLPQQINFLHLDLLALVQRLEYQLILLLHQLPQQAEQLQQHLHVLLEHGPILQLHMDINGNGILIQLAFGQM